MSATSAYYKRIAGGFVGTELTVGPWSPKLQHGGPPSALIARQLQAEATKAGMDFVGRVTIQFFRPVKLSATLELEGQAVRVGTKVAHVAASLFERVGDEETGKSTRVELMRASGLCSRFASVPALAAPASLVLTAPRFNPEQLDEQSRMTSFFSMPFRFGYAESLRTHIAEGEHGKGPSFIWASVPTKLVDDDNALASPLERTLIWADSAGGMSFYVDFAKTSFINADTTLNLLRPMEGEWVGMKARTDLAPEFGNGLASAELFDQRGFFGRVAQQQILENRVS
jgi:hypothetical protein